MDARPELRVMKFSGELYRMKPSGSGGEGPFSPALGGAGSSSLSSVGCSLVITYRNPFSGFTATPPQFAPPLWPGNEIVPRKLGGVYKPSLREFLSNSRILACSASVAKGLMSFSVKLSRANGGGLLGKGCVGELNSPGTSDCGTGRSSTGHRGSPVT